MDVDELISNGCVVPLPAAAGPIGVAVEVPSVFSTSIARRPTLAPGLRLTVAVISVVEIRFTINTAMSAACVLPLELARLASFGEMTTLAPGLKFAPCNVSCIRPAPCTARPGAALVSTGGGPAAGFTISGNGADVPPGTVNEGLKTVISSVPCAAMSVARIAAVICVALTNAVVRPAPFTCTTDPAKNPVPFTVSVNPGPPAVTLGGAMDVIVGTP